MATGWDRCKLIVLMGGYLILLVGVSLGLPFVLPGLTWKDILEPVAVALTGLVVIWYTWETHRLRVYAARQVELQLQPYLVMELVQPGPDVRRYIAVKNIGNGTAVNVRIRDIMLPPQKGDPNQYAIRVVGSAPWLPVGDSAKLRQETIVNGEPIEQDTMATYLYPAFARGPAQVAIEFQNIDLAPYRIEYEIDKDKISMGRLLRLRVNSDV